MKIQNIIPFSLVSKDFYSFDLHKPSDQKSFIIHCIHISSIFFCKSVYVSYRAGLMWMKLYRWIKDKSQCVAYWIAFFFFLHVTAVQRKHKRRIDLISMLHILNSCYSWLVGWLVACTLYHTKTNYIYIRWYRCYYSG